MNNESYFLKLANGSIWHVASRQPETNLFVERFAAVCSMNREPPEHSANLLSCHVYSFNRIAEFRAKHPELIETGRKLYFKIFFDSTFENSFVFYNMSEYLDETAMMMGVGFLRNALQLQLIGNGCCAPCHCALVKINQHGAVIGGRGDTGKTTCARRIPSPHQAYADDYALVFEHEGQFLAQAMPTWSDYRKGWTSYSADCSQIINLDACFFLEQSQTDRIEPINGIQAVQYANNAMQDLLCVGIVIDMPDELKYGFRVKLFDFAQRLAKAIPTFLLHATLHGDFWNKMSEVLDEN